ncbi:glutathione synthase [Vibrio inusitatus NBRC 102082]|uniref:Glutathione synthase n=1 Tax=Vibrio inusitatus NBRC 102082 TaxID=1219070 RepID=A0A4Y3HYM0_9VIBR|nr:alpha-L-glutamate ligase [Vibrio inusitatus]GEA52226.1 glutathione synthase [Vibrio inusitatus NBRC 102082]
MKSIYILHENEEWIVPLREAFDKLNVPAKEWFVNEGHIEFDTVPENAVYYNRMSASSHTRDHRYAPELTRVIDKWLGLNKATVVNGNGVIDLEVCKISQYAALQQEGIATPKTQAVVGADFIVSAAEKFNTWPLIIKPNRGGKGLGVEKFNSLDDVKLGLRRLKADSPLDGIWLLQEYVKSTEPYIVRCEYVGGKFLYAVKVSTEGGFELCPADGCSIENAFCPAFEDDKAEQQQDKFEITDILDNSPLIKLHEQFLAKNQIDIAGIEVICDESGKWYSYDVNTNTNYNSKAEIKAGVPKSGMEAIAEYLVKVAEES